ncbi:enoyl-CoA hydratase/isomerase family protein [Roseovarius sp. LXJ103]|uniref:enoyl-CoA hydratase/isomerase family protein n=1 Tax=Roseovarius carneus TaxID=2853164 RepID=UPI000D621D2D|nr:enoyl-CoA hydratase/isomerase family protein [Roseovarius carneus]MBZ8119038.1 enoyl-CoA hydratase/isomerase family protein [Roseovarius carneus]PWE35313.1 enoyl-CoA hydratase [Pelagicola sp. LXJ1103]
MTSEIHIRREGAAGRITLDRPNALNALTYAMCGQIETALDAWEHDTSVKHIMIDAVGEKAFCAGGDIQDLYAAGKEGDFAFGQRFWADEYRLNARLAEYPKPVISFLQGFTMGGGVGIGCHGSHRIVDAGSQIAMPECSIGLVPDVGGSLILARAPGRLGAYLGLTTARMKGADAIYAGFADFLIPQEAWPTLKDALIAGEDAGSLAQNAVHTGETTLPALQDCIDAHFGGETLGDILHALNTSVDTEFAASALKMIARNSPLAMACAVEMIARLRAPDADIRTALAMEYRFTFRALEHSDFIEGVRAQVIDKDRTPCWKHNLDDVPEEACAQMLASLGADELSFEKKG